MKGKRKKNKNKKNKNKKNKNKNEMEKKDMAEGKVGEQEGRMDTWGKGEEDNWMTIMHNANGYIKKCVMIKIYNSRNERNNIHLQINAF